MERVYSGLDEFSIWRQSIVDGTVDRREVSIEYLRNNDEVVRKYTLISAYPSKWELPELDAGGSNTAVEKITLSVESVIQEL